MKRKRKPQKHGHINLNKYEGRERHRPRKVGLVKDRSGGSPGLLGLSALSNDVTSAKRDTARLLIFLLFRNLFFGYLSFPPTHDSGDETQAPMIPPPEWSPLNSQLSPSTKFHSRERREIERENYSKPSRIQQKRMVKNPKKEKWKQLGRQVAA